MILRWICLVFLFSSAAFGEIQTLHVMTIPKSGTNLIGKLIKLLKKEGELPLKGRIVHFYMNPHYHRGIDLLEVPEFKRMTLIRDLRDVAVSLVYFLDKLGPSQKIIVLPDSKDNDHYYSLATFEERLSYILTPNNRFNGFLLRNCEGCVSSLLHPDILMVRFEELVGSKGGGSDQSQREAILKIVDFMGFTLGEAALGRIQEDLFGSSPTFRKGQIGSWREEFSDQNLFLFEQTFGMFNRSLGY